MSKKDVRVDIIHTIRNKCVPAAGMIDHVLEGERLSESDQEDLRIARKAMSQMLAYADKLAAELKYDELCG